MKKRSPMCIRKWNDIFKLEENDWAEIFYLPYSITRKTKLQTFQYKVLHRIFPCRYWLHKCKITDNNDCVNCDQINTIAHYFIERAWNHTLWKCLTRWLSIILDLSLDIEITAQDILFGFISDREKNAKYISMSLITLFS